MQYEVQGYNARGERIFTDWRKSAAAAERLAASKRTPTAERTGAYYVVVEVAR